DHEIEAIIDTGFNGSLTLPAASWPCLAFRFAGVDGLFWLMAVKLSLTFTRRQLFGTERLVVYQSPRPIRIHFWAWACSTAMSWQLRSSTVAACRSNHCRNVALTVTSQKLSFAPSSFCSYRWLVLRHLR